MRLGLAPITEAAGRMMTEEAAGLAEEDREDIKLSPSFLRKIQNILITPEGHWQSADYG